jgi:quinol monooxygenase YgiN
MLARQIGSRRGHGVEQIQVTARFPQIAKENLDEFKRLAGDALKVTSEDPGVPQYDWFFSQDETTCVVRETYAGSEAVLAHVAMVGEALGTLIELGGGVEIEVFGSPSDELLEAISAMQPRVYSYFQGK